LEIKNNLILNSKKIENMELYLNVCLVLIMSISCYKGKLEKLTNFLISFDNEFKNEFEQELINKVMNVKMILDVLIDFIY
jgi:hypothetical protein